ncbi:glycosyl hydrolase [Prolixibacter sp. NT017]|nr:glycosyl hydrolase [Prolixibacter sp. NT017]
MHKLIKPFISMKKSLVLIAFGIGLIFAGCQSTQKKQTKTENVEVEETTCAGQAGCASDCLSKHETEALNTLTAQEKADGWQLLFDGKTLNGWKGFAGNDISQGWVVRDGSLMSLGKGGDIGGDIITDKQYENFELKLEWRISHGGNSGILYGVIDDPKYGAVYYTGPEYQLLDDVGFPEKVEEWQLTGANYGMYTADKSKKKLQMVGGPAFNTARIIVNGNHVEQWLNGEKVVEFERWTDDWNKRKNEGKWKDYPDYGMAKVGHISLQDHGSYIWFRNIKIREL